jgi:hypothetical protein
MSSYLPSELWVVAVLAAALLVVLMAGYTIGRYLPAGISRALVSRRRKVGPWTTLGVDHAGSSTPASVWRPPP